MVFQKADQTGTAAQQRDGCRCPDDPTGERQYRQQAGQSRDQENKIRDTVQPGTGPACRMASAGNGAIQHVGDACQCIEEKKERVQRCGEQQAQRQRDAAQREQVCGRTAHDRRLQIVFSSVAQHKPSVNKTHG